MKKIRLIVVINMLLVITNILAQGITPIQLKEARMAVYDWVKSYKRNSSLRYEHNADAFLSLFSSENVRIVDDFLPRTIDGDIAVIDYVTNIRDENNPYKTILKIESIKVKSEKVIDGMYLCYLEVNKSISFKRNEKGCFYPPKEYVSNITLMYDFDEKKIFSDGITTEDSLEVELILYDGQTIDNNRYILNADTISLLNEDSFVLIDKYLFHNPEDNKIVVIKEDTIKNKFSIGGSIGLNSYNKKFKEFVLFDNYSSSGRLSCDVVLSYYKQLSLTGKKAWGFCVQPSFLMRRGVLSMDYYASYSDVDIDGGEYQRNIDVTNYNERFNRYALDLPVSMRYDYYFKLKDNNYMSFFTDFGVGISCYIVQQSEFETDVEYSGYYDWIFPNSGGVILNQNGIYDFGTYHIVGECDKLGLGNLALNAFVSVGIQYFFNNKYSVEAFIQYKNTFYTLLNNSDNLLLTSDKNNWFSATNLFKYYLDHNCSVGVKLNYNF